MHLALPLIFLSFFVLQQSINVESVVSPILSADSAGVRPSIARRLRAPLMGRSLLSTNDDNDDSNDESNSSSADDEMVYLAKRRSGAPLFGRRWIPTKRRGPLFG